MIISFLQISPWLLAKQSSAEILKHISAREVLNCEVNSIHSLSTDLEHNPAIEILAIFRKKDRLQIKF